MLTAEGKRKPIREFTIHDVLYKIIRMLQRSILKLCCALGNNTRVLNNSKERK